MLSSDISEHKVFEDYASGYDLMPNMLHYLGIDTNIIRPKSIEEMKIANPQDIVVYDGDNLRQYMSLKDSRIYF